MIKDSSSRVDGAKQDASGDLLSEREFLLQEFPIKKTRSYLNNASIGVVPASAVDGVASFYEEVQATGRNNYLVWCAFADGPVKQRIAQ